MGIDRPSCFILGSLSRDRSEVGGCDVSPKTLRPSHPLTSWFDGQVRDGPSNRSGFHAI